MNYSTHKTTVATLIIVLFVLGLGYLVYFMIYAPAPIIQTENPPVITLPAKITYSNATSNLIVVDLPFPDAVVGKDFSVIGKARGTWFFEASFPIEVLDENGKSLAVGIAQAQDEWMTENFVPFRADMKIPLTYIGKATLILKKDNPSGLPEHDAYISFPITIEY